MSFFNYRGDTLFAEDIPVADIARQHGTPCYIYSRAALEQHFTAYQDALASDDHLICYAVKANSNLAVLDVLARLGAGFDIVSIGELERVVAAGGDPAKTIFSGVAKTAAEMRRALELGIACFNIESAPELEVLNTVAADMKVVAPISVRVNPDVDAGTHPYISTGLRENKFGLTTDVAIAVYRRAQELPHISIKGIDCHIGSQLTETAPFIDAIERLLITIEQLEAEGIHIEHLDIGGGLGVCYKDESPPPISDYIAAVKDALQGRKLKLILEPGRSIAANAGILVTQVQYLKPTDAMNFALVDAAMNDMLRPSLYQAWLNIVPVNRASEAPTAIWNIVGPVCESGDFLGKERELALKPEDFLALTGAGAYGFTMSSNYNTRPRAAEIMVDGNNTYVIRQREVLGDLWRTEQRLPEGEHE